MVRMEGVHLLDRLASPAGAIDVSAALDLTEGAGGRRLVCRACGHNITSEGARVAAFGAHEHTKENPAGLVFRIGCFRAAPGVRELGPEVAEHTWFAGYTWQIAVCGACGIHLGWVFRSGADRFYGLVLARLCAVDERASHD